MRHDSCQRDTWGGGVPDLVMPIPPPSTAQGTGDGMCTCAPADLRPARGSPRRWAAGGGPKAGAHIFCDIGEVKQPMHRIIITSQMHHGVKQDMDIGFTVFRPLSHKKKDARPTVDGRFF